MISICMIIAILLPVLGGIGTLVFPFSNRKMMCVYVEMIAVVTSLIVLYILLGSNGETVTLFSFTRELHISLRLDAVGKVFAVIVSFLWPFSTLYSFEYMKHEGHERSFYMFYLMTYGVTLGIAMAENIVAMYFFYEMLTMVTIPLVIHTLTKEAVNATRTYMYYSLGGAAFAFIGMIFILMYGTTSSFVPGGVLDMALVGDNKNLILFIYVICFCGFSVKAAMFPFSGWLPKAGVAPTPVTALLHAVAVVKAGAFACIRVTYFCFGCDVLKGTWAQNLLLLIVSFTIVYGCSRALKETHFKRRLAWSTVSNLSYILFGALLMSPWGLMGALMHMVCHALMKISSFFCAGAVICKSERHFVHELDGIGRKMPKTMIIYTISSLALMGVPGLPGFVSKWNLAKGAVSSQSVMGNIGLAALLISALLTAIYMLTVSVRAFFPGKAFDYTTLDGIKDPTWQMLVPLVTFTVLMFLIGLHPDFLSGPIQSVVNQVF